MDLYSLFITSFNKGGIVMWPILIVSIVSWTIGIEKLFFLNSFIKERNKFWDLIKTKDINNSDKLFKNSNYKNLVLNLNKVKIGKSAYKYVFREFLIVSANQLEKDFNTINAWIATAPLLGLLGTVAGMIHTFKIITDFGIGNPHLMAEGISIALLTTQAGLTVAFPAMLFLNHLANKKKMIVSMIIKDGEVLSKKFTS